MNLGKIVNLTGKKMVDILIWGVVISGLLVGALFAAGLIRFTFDMNDLMYMGVAVVVGFVVAFLLNKKFGGMGGAAPSGGMGSAPAEKPQAPAAPPQQPPAPAPAQ